VVQNDVGNRHSPTTVVVAISTTLPPKPFPFVVTITPQESGLPAPSAINCAQIAAVQQDGPDSRLRPSRGEEKVRAICQLTAVKMAEVGKALRFNLAL
jgi:mRNA interferase MazF